MYLTSVTTGYDPHSTYMSPGTLEDFQIQMRLNLDGIGAQLREKDGTTVVSRVIPGGAADKHGKLKTDDLIVTVGQGDDGEMVDIVEMPLTDVVDLIRGRAGTTVRLGVRPGGVGNVEIYKIVRARVELEESAARGEVIEHPIPESDSKLKIGYINLPSFYLDMESAKEDKRDFRSSTRDVRRILDDFRAQGVDGVVLDLSKNGGGSLTEAINLTGLFIDRGPVVQVKNADGSVQQYADEESGTSWDGPLVVMTSKFSASASEIFAGAIKDYRRGIIVGDPTTHGKGTVQTLMDLGRQLFRTQRENYGALKVTLQQFYLPDGESTQLKGVAADIVLPSITAKMDIGEGDLKYALQHGTVKQARHDIYSMVPPDLIGSIRQRSMKRVSENKEFQDLLRRIASYVSQKEENEVPLEEGKFFARRKELDAQEQEEEEQLEAQINNEQVYRDNFYNEEVINITSDYIQGLKSQNLAKAG
jgi:carboxyl-terminal processing protease